MSAHNWQPAPDGHEHCSQCGLFRMDATGYNLTWQNKVVEYIYRRADWMSLQVGDVWDDCDVALVQEVLKS